ncbi:MAG: glycosyl hydrolase family protein [Rhodospirillaceae bacterium]|nr:MAG: glycosyl hydrolase family protein [Rhodospirillaceae bacterium]
MNLSQPLRSISRLVHVLCLRCRHWLPRQRCLTFVTNSESTITGIGPIVVINLDRQKSRWTDIVRELNHITDAVGTPLSDRVVRYSAFDARLGSPTFFDDAIIDPHYSLSDQLYVEPQPDAHMDTFDLDHPIRMSQAEVAVACSHIGVWRDIARSSASHTLVLEDDVWFERRFGRVLEQAWREIEGASQAQLGFDILYLSYKEVRHGAPKELLSKNVFRPDRGLWYMSGYVLSKRGAQALLDLLPCRGPIDLWVNHKFRELEVRALRRSVINQRRDLDSTNSYSVLPALARIGILNSGDASLFHQRPIHSPVFAFGDPGTGLSSLAAALSMLGYRCCSDFDSIPDIELKNLLSGHRDRIFDAYVNIGSLGQQIRALRQRYPSAKYIVMTDEAVRPTVSDIGIITDALEGADVLHLQQKHTSSWRKLCEHLKMAPPDARYPAVDEIGLRSRQSVSDRGAAPPAKRLRCDPSPWIAKPRPGWAGISAVVDNGEDLSESFLKTLQDDLNQIHSARWLLRNDTFPGNLGLFRPDNVTFAASGGLSLAVARESLGVRNFSAAAISSRASFLFGRFEATLQATNVPGLVTGFFLHRNSPRQEIDVEILGNKPDELLVNVFYNPGSDGAKFDYGYRGTPAVIKLGFDASKAPHHYMIEWSSCEIRWFVDQRLVHRRTTWDPTPIPHLPMKLHVNTWPTRSREFGGRLALHALPASSFVRRITIRAYDVEARGQCFPSISAARVSNIQTGDSIAPTAMESGPN